MSFINQDKIGDQTICNIPKILKEIMRKSSANFISEEFTKESKIKINYRCPLALRKLNCQIFVLISFEIYSASIQLKIKAESMQGSTLILKNLINQRTEEICQFINLTNMLQINERSIILLISESTEQLIGRMNIGKSFIFDNRQKLAKYLNQKINRANKIYAEAIESILIYYKQSSNNDESEEWDSLKKQRKNVQNLKQLFEIRRRNRKRSTKINLAATKNKIVTMVINIVQLSKVDQNIKNQQSKLSAIQVEEISKQFETQSKLLENFFSTENLKGYEYITTPFNILNIKKQSSLCTGGYAELYYGLYDFISYRSINYLDFQGFLNSGIQAQTEVSKNLVCKVSICQNDNISIKNQMLFLNYVRNRKCPQLARYYLQNFFVKNQPNILQIYSDYYPYTIDQCKFMQEVKLRIFQQISFGLLFLKQVGVVHHDIKQFNIMISKKRNAKLIDFGSVVPMHGIQYFQGVDKKLRSTKGYYMPYHTATENINSLKSKYNRQQYNNHEQFDIYSFGIVLKDQFYLETHTAQNNFIRHNLDYLSNKCTQINPEDRLTIEEVIIFVRSLLEFISNQKTYWKHIHNTKQSQNDSKLNQLQKKKDNLQNKISLNEDGNKNSVES